MTDKSVVNITNTKNTTTTPVENQPVLESGKKVLTVEAEALNSLAQSLDQNFVEAVDLIENAEGRVIVTGMGKSGHIGCKIAATLASTGTPAFFVHPSEASHGDMGMIVRGDVVLALSNSGESKELFDLIAYTRRFAIPLIAITKRAGSQLGSQSDIILQLPDFPEACPNGLAPTTSTTSSLALGDALAVALLKRKGFSAQDFGVYHPGGKLGQQLMKTSEIMHVGAELPLVTKDTTMQKALDMMTDKGFGCVGIIDEQGILLGMITDGDIRRHLADGFLDRSVLDIMTENPQTITPDTLVGAAVGIMNNVTGAFRKITVLFVTDESGKPVGLLHLHDCLRAGFG